MQTIQLRSSSDPDSDVGPGSKGEAWIDIELADDEGLRWLSSAGGLDDEIIERLLEPASATYWRRFGQGLHFHVNAPAVPSGDTSATRIQDFGFWLEPGRIITICHGEVPALARAAEACSEGTGPSSSWELVTFILSEGLGRFERILHDLSATIDQLEDDVLTGEGGPPIQRLAELQKRLVYVRRFRGPLAMMLNFISSQPSSAIEPALRDELEGIGTVAAQQQDLLGFDRSGLGSAGPDPGPAQRFHEHGHVSLHLGGHVFLPLSFLTGLLGINVAGIPGDHDPSAFWLVCGALCVIAASWGIVVGRLTSRARRRSEPRDT